MELYLNREQSKGLANFFFDMAKGILLGSLGLVTVAEAKIAIILVGCSLLYITGTFITK